MSLRDFGPNTRPLDPKSPLVEPRDPSSTNRQIRKLNTLLLAGFFAFAILDGLSLLDLEAAVILGPLTAIVGGAGLVSWRRVREQQRSDPRESRILSTWERESERR